MLSWSSAETFFNCFNVAILKHWNVSVKHKVSFITESHTKSASFPALTNTGISAYRKNAVAIQQTYLLSLQLAEGVFQKN